MGEILVVGGGVAGMQASIDLADLGHNVILLEKSDELGGNLKNLKEISPSRQNAADVLSTYLDNIKRRKIIRVIKRAEILGFEGDFPAFQVRVKTPDWTGEFTVNAVILATGVQIYDPSPLREYGYGRFKDVVTSLELEKMLSDERLVRPSDNQRPRSVAFIQCVGSRDCTTNPYCSSFCCNNAVKLAKIIEKENPEIAVSIFYMDIRTPNEGEIEFRDARRLGILFRRGKPARIREEEGRLKIEVEDTLENDLIFIHSDLVVLCVGGVPDQTVNSLSDLMKVKLMDSGFFKADEATCETNVKGILVAGSAAGPKDIEYSMVQGSCAAGKVDILLRTSLKAEVTG